MKKITVIGHFGFKKNLINGQTIKTKIITTELKKTYGEKMVIMVDTRGNFFKRIFSFIKIFFSFFKSSDIVFLPARGGIYTIVSLLLFLNVSFKRRLHYVVIGGWIGDLAREDTKLNKKLKKINFIYPETKLIENQLNCIGIFNTFVMPNGKELAILPENEVKKPESQIIKMCTFSRVSEQKGIRDAIEATILANKESNGRKFLLDIYGQIKNEELDWFDNLKTKFGNEIRYCGEVDYDKSTETLSNYDILLFPTYYPGEGFAGTIIDAFSAGLPVIASNWKSNSEIVDAKTGYLFESCNIDALKSSIINATEDLDRLFMMKKECLKRASKYKISNVIKILCNNIES